MVGAGWGKLGEVDSGDLSVQKGCFKGSQGFPCEHRGFAGDEGISVDRRTSSETYIPPPGAPRSRRSESRPKRLIVALGCACVGVVLLTSVHSRHCSDHRPPIPLYLFPPPPPIACVWVRGCGNLVRPVTLVPQVDGEARDRALRGAELVGARRAPGPGSRRRQRRWHCQDLLDTGTALVIEDWFRPEYQVRGRGEGRGTGGPGGTGGTGDEWA